MNNKQIGTAWEIELCGRLAVNGWWVHFITPDARGAQPFDIIAAKGKAVLAIECKTESSDTFHLSRLEENQIMALQKWYDCTKRMPIIAIRNPKRDGYVEFVELKKDKTYSVSMLRPIENLFRSELWV